MTTIHIIISVTADMIVIIATHWTTLTRSQPEGDYKLVTYFLSISLSPQHLPGN